MKELVFKELVFNKFIVEALINRVELSVRTTSPLLKKTHVSKVGKIL